MHCAISAVNGAESDRKGEQRRGDHGGRPQPSFIPEADFRSDIHRLTYARRIGPVSSNEHARVSLDYWPDATH
jgi:hypothetical protein